MIEKFLTDIGLSEKEANIYLQLLSVGAVSVIDLAQMTKINRTSLYPLLESLQKKDLVSEVKEDKKIRYQAEPPERLVTFLENEKNRILEQEKLLNEVVPRLKSVSLKTGEAPIIKVLEGREGILKSVQNYFENTTEDEVVNLFYPKDIVETMFTEKELIAARGSRVKRKVKAISIYTTKGEARLSDEMSERHKIDPEKYPIYCDIGIFNDNVKIHTVTKNLSAIYIKNKDFADTMRTMFKLALEGIKEKEKKNI
jgi:sugar-specific transcriptional regulator TrmB